MTEIKAGDRAIVYKRRSWGSDTYDIIKASVKRVTPTGIVIVDAGNWPTGRPREFAFKPSPHGWKAMREAKCGSYEPDYELAIGDELAEKAEWLKKKADDQKVYGGLSACREKLKAVTIRDLDAVEQIAKDMLKLITDHKAKQEALKTN